MGFNWDGETFTEDSGGGQFINEEKFLKLIYTDAVVQIFGVREGVSNYNGQEKPQWLVDFVAPDGETWTKGVAKGNAERDARMKRLQSTLNESPDDPIPSTPFKVGRRIEFGRPKVTA